jgi:DNA repair exonuclease SbcCD nuclease subunit
MKVIAVGDPHFQTSNIPEVNLFIDKLEELAKKEQPDLIVILGDVLHTHERLHTLPLNKAYEFVERMRNVAKTFVLVGNHDMCFAKNTPILMWDGTVKNSENISIGDILVGDDNKPRQVLSTIKGKSKMYTIKQLNAIDYTVTENHILSLLPGFHKSIFWNNTKKRWTVKWIEKLKLRSKFFRDKNEADAFLHTISDCDIINISVKDYLTVPKNVRDRLYGFKTSIDWEKQNVELDPYILGMWLGDGCKMGYSFASADIELINEWEKWAVNNGCEITHTGQYNYRIRLAGRNKDKQPLGFGSDFCNACQKHKKIYGRSYSLACASVEELELLINADTRTVKNFTEGASSEQSKFIQNTDNIRNLYIFRKNKIEPIRKQEYKNPLTLGLKLYDLIDNKHIPLQYIRNDRETRLKLLAGFIDTDGTVIHGRNICITQSEKHSILIDQLALLSRTLGFSAQITQKQNEYGIFKILNISGEKLSEIPTKLPRKKLFDMETRDSRGRKHWDIRRTAIRVEESTDTEFFGWETDGNNRFVLSDLTVVHNCNNQQFLSPNHWMNGMKEWDNVEVIDTVVHRKVKGIHLVFCPYVPPGRFQDALNSNEEEDWKDADCIFAHQEFYGCKMGAIVSVEGDKWPEDFPKVVSGHIHSRQMIGKNIYYCGSSMQHAFGESDKNIIPILTWTKTGNPYSLEEVDLELPRKKIIYTDVQGMEDYEAPETEDKIKITISGVYDEFKAFKKTKKYRELVKNGTKIVFKPKKIRKEDDGDETEEKKDMAEPMEETDFNRILSSLISKEKSNFLYQVFELVVNNKTVEEEDILFL